MKISRRTLIKSVAGLGLLAGLGGWLKARFRSGSVTSSREEDFAQASSMEQTLRAFIETLIPADEMPGAGELGVAAKILEQTNNQTTFRKLLKSGCDWLDEKANKSGLAGFADLDEQQRIHIVTLAAESRQNSMEYVFFASVRDLSFSEYYADPRSWSGLGYAGPPQPRGFVDYTAAPVKPDVG